MPKRRQLDPQSLFDEPALREWLAAINCKEHHLRLMWKHSETFLVDPERRNHCDPPRIADLPKVIYETFSKSFCHCTSRVIDYQSSEHGGKLLIELQNGTHQIETVIIHHHHHSSLSLKQQEQNNNNNNRSTVCISSQVGCRMNCSFCATGTMGLVANLTAGELVEQVWHARQKCPTITNVVLMGMGEPLDNYQVVKDAILSLQKSPFQIPLARITVSTVGVVSKIRQLALDCPGVTLAVSLHAPNDPIRHQIVPTAKQYNIQSILEAVQFYQDQAQSVKRKSVMIEYIMIAGVNDSCDNAHELGKLLQGREFLVNLIPYNPTVAGDRFGYDSPSDETMKAFQDILYQYPSSNPNKALRCTIRWSSRRGQSLDAACGQLVLAKNNQHKQQQQHVTTNNHTTNNDNNDNNIKDMEDYGNNTRKAVIPVLPKGRNSRSKRVVEPPPPLPDKEDDPDDELSMLSISFIGPILLSGLVAVGVTMLVLQRRAILTQRRGG